jgi:hypothetical protein
MEAIGPVLLVASIPLLLRWVPRNGFYGFRIPATLRSDSVWYDVNALCGRHLFLLGLVLVILEFVVPLSMRIPVLRAVALIGVVAIIASGWRTANRWDRERKVVR